MKKLISYRLDSARSDRMFKPMVYRCDICEDEIKEIPDNFEVRMRILDEIDGSYENELDRSTYEQGPKLILCDYCSKAYLMPSYIYY
jgi:hypothetical protein